MDFSRNVVHELQETQSIKVQQEIVNEARKRAEKLGILDMTAKGINALNPLNKLRHEKTTEGFSQDIKDDAHA